jgi:hypothetical protein
MIDPNEPAQSSVSHRDFLSAGSPWLPQSANPPPAPRKAFSEVLLPPSLLTTTEKGTAV